MEQVFEQKHQADYNNSKPIHINEIIYLARTMWTTLKSIKELIKGPYITNLKLTT